VLLSLESRLPDAEHLVREQGGLTFLGAGLPSVIGGVEPLWPVTLGLVLVLVSFVVVDNTYIQLHTHSHRCICNSLGAGLCHKCFFSGEPFEQIAFFCLSQFL